MEVYNGHHQENALYSEQEAKASYLFSGCTHLYRWSAGDVERIGSAADRVCDHQPGAGIGK